MSFFANARNDSILCDIGESRDRHVIPSDSEESPSPILIF